jgi:hypothetical protein
MIWWLLLQVYKSLNTFIDDLFAFIIKMPTMHRLSCFRDDIIFFIYLYQRWIYPVDKKRINEFGQITDDNKVGESEVLIWLHPIWVAVDSVRLHLQRSVESEA